MVEWFDQWWIHDILRVGGGGGGLQILDNNIIGGSTGVGARPVRPPKSATDRATWISECPHYTCFP